MLHSIVYEPNVGVELFQQLQLCPSAVNVSLPAKVMVVRMRCFLLPQVVVLFCLCAYLFYIIIFSYLCRVNLQALTLSPLSVKPNCWEDLPYTTVPCRFSSEAAGVVKL